MEHDFSSLPLRRSALAGRFSEPSSRNYAHHHLSDTPTGESGVLEVTWPAGARAGVSPGRFDAWDELALKRATRYGEIYLSMHLRIPGTDFENQKVGTKLWYVAYGNTRHLNDAFLMLHNGGRSKRLMRAFTLNMQVSPRDIGGSRPHYQNVNPRPLLTVGRWHQVEVYLKAGTPGLANGAIRAWVDGQLVMAYDNVQFLDPVNNYTEGFFHFQWTPVWGGNNGDRRSRDDRLQLDHLYISGRR